MGARESRLHRYHNITIYDYIMCVKEVEHLYSICSLLLSVLSVDFCAVWVGHSGA